MDRWPTLMNPAYGLMMLVGVIASAVMWKRIARDRPELVMVYAGALVGALVGAKLGFIIAELPFHFGEQDFLFQALIGRTILGGLLGGYFGAEWAKRLIGYQQATGDWFAVIVPLALAFGRVGCFLHGCCRGVTCEPAWYTMTDVQGLARWPAPLVEMLFNFGALLCLGILYRIGAGRGQLFHLYLIAYGLFRIAHEPLRDTPRFSIGGGWTVTTYQLLAAVLVMFATGRFVVRWREQHALGQADLAGQVRLSVAASSP